MLSVLPVPQFLYIAVPLLSSQEFLFGACRADVENGYKEGNG